ncbi:MAG: polysaccharide biosynthesis protein [Bacteroidetes bacterium]|nr:polysaccharide biosynthesis protein [Bacteroidota bacterium]
MVLKKLASQTAVYGLSTMVGRFLNFLLVPLYTAKLANVDDYGEVNVIFSYAGFLAVIFSYGMETGFFNFARKNHHPEKVFSTATISLCFSGLLLFIFSLLFSQPIMDEAGYPEHPNYAIWFAAILGADAISSLFFAWLRFDEKPWKFAGIRLLNIGINILCNLFFILVCPWLLNHGYTWVNNIFNSENLVQYIFISNLVSSLIILPFFGNLWKKLRGGFDRDLFKKMMKYSIPLVVVGFAGMINETLDRILLKQLLPANQGDYQAGIYGAFYKLSMIMTLFVQAFRFAAEPFFFKHSEHENAKESYAYILKWFVYVCGFIYVATIALLPWLGPLLIRNTAYFQNADGLAIVPVLLLANLCLGIYYNLSTWYKLNNKTGTGAIISAIAAGITLAGNFYGIPKFGFVASAWTTLAAYASLMFMGYFLGKKHFPVPYPIFKITLSILFAIALGYVATEYHSIVPFLSILAIPGFVLLVWMLESSKNARRKNQKHGQ